MPKLHEEYLHRVFNFIDKHGPFSFDFMEMGRPVYCDCCGRGNLRQHFHIQGARGDIFVVGLECQEMLLDVTEAYLPTSSVRRLDIPRLRQLAGKYDVPVHPDIRATDLAQLIIDKRRSVASKIAWQNRR